MINNNIHKDTVKVINISEIRSTGVGRASRIIIPSDIREILNLDIGDNILYIEDRKNNIIIRKAVLEDTKKETDNRFAKIIEITMLTGSKKKGIYVTSIPEIIRKKLGVDIGEDIIFVLNGNGEIIIRNSYLEL